jgi:hypothetical protein
VTRHRRFGAAPHTPLAVTADGKIVRVNPLEPLVQIVQPIIVQTVGQPAPELGMGELIIQALGLTGLIVLASILVGLVLGAALIWHRMRRREEVDGQYGGQIQLHLEPPNAQRANS